MATFYLDMEGGNDANDGTTFANRWKTITNGATAARIAPGDTIRIMGSPAPTSCGINATWTGAQSSATSKSIVSSTNASPISVQVTAHGYSTGDTVVTSSHTTNTSANGTWEITVTDADNFTLDGSTGNGVGGATGSVRKINNAVVRLASPLTQNIASFGNRGNGRIAWTQSANVTASLLSSTTKEGDVSDQFAIAAGFTTGMAAYFATGTLDLSGYQGVSFWFRQSSNGAFNLELLLCTDTAGTVPVHNVTVPDVGTLNAWHCHYWNNGSALNSSIKSIALNVLSDAGAQTVQISNIVAVKANGNDSLNITSLIGKNNGTDAWYTVQSINGNRVVLDLLCNTVPANDMKGYSGTSETVALYKRETIKLTPLGGTSSLHTIQDSGTAGNLITFDGGWDRTNMSTRTLDTWIDGINGAGHGIKVNSKAYVQVSNIAFVRYAFGLSGESVVGTGCVFDLVAGHSCNEAARLSNSNGSAGTGFTVSLGWGNNNQGGLNIPSSIGASVISLGEACNNQVAGFTTVASNLIVDYIGKANNNSSGISIGAGAVNCLFKSIGETSYNSSYGIAVVSVSNAVFENVGTQNYNLQYGILISACDNVLLCNGSASGNLLGSVSIAGSLANQNSLINYLMSDSDEVVFSSNFLDSQCFSHKHDQTANNHVVFYSGGRAAAATDQRHTSSGLSWKFTPTSTVRTSFYPLQLALGKIALLANVTKTIGIYCRRDSTDINGRLLIRGGKVAGIAADVTTTCAPSVNTWTQYTANVTPTEDCVIEVLFQVYDGVGTTNAFWIDDLTVE